MSEANDKLRAKTDHVDQTTTWKGRKEKEPEEVQMSDVIGGYLLCMVGFFALCTAVTDLRAALWMFGGLYGGCTLAFIILWWQDSHRELRSKLEQTPPIKTAQPAHGILEKQTV